MIKSILCFHLSTISSSMYISKLIDLITKEINVINKYTRNNDKDKESKHHVNDFLSSTQFKLKESEDSRKITLEKKDEDNKVAISFLSTSLFNDKRSLITQPNIIMDFNVSIEKNTNNREMIFECRSMLKEAKYSILSIYTFNKNASKPLYPYSPNVNSFDIGMKKGFQSLLFEQGITKDMVRLIKYLALEKEQRLYKKWLEDIKSLI